MKKLWIISICILVSLVSCSSGLKINRAQGIKGPNAPMIKGSAVTFRISAPDATLVTLVGNFNGWNALVQPLQKDVNGLWTLELELAKGRTYYYKFVVDGFWVADPDNPDFTPDSRGSTQSVLVLN